MKIASMETVPKYRSHKLVGALRIFAVKLLPKELAEIVFDDPDYAPLSVALHGRPTPQAGWYMVWYDTGYFSFSPAGAFQMGNESLEILFERAALAAHEANRLLCLSMGDGSQVPWSKAEDWQKDSARLGVKRVWESPLIDPPSLHESWMGQKFADGWVYGKTKDVEKKTHPCMVPYNDLPENQRLKDEMFSRVVRSVLGV